MTQLESEVAEESSGHPSTRLMFTSFLQNVIQRLFSTFMAQKLLDDQKRLSRREEGARCSLPIANSFLTCLSGLVSKL
jgi:hypothetical protein